MTFAQPDTRRLQGRWRWLLLFALVALLAACGEGDPAVGETPTATTGPIAGRTPGATATESGAGMPTSSPAPAAGTAAPEAYPLPPPSPTPRTYPVASPTPRPPASTTPRPSPYPAHEAFLPLIFGPPVPTPTPTPSVTPQPTATHTPVPTPTPTIDFNAVRAQLRAGGNDLGFAKIGFHTGSGGNAVGLGEWMRRLDAAGVPFFLKSADDFGPIREAQEIVRQSSVPHVLVFRLSGDAFDTPEYDLTPREAARRHWALHKAALPPELDPALVWIETINEVDKGRARWLAQFASETARLALADGYRWAAFGWASGEPEEADWETPEMLAFLRLVGQNPDRLAISLHEYSYLRDNIGDAYPFKVGRFQLLFAACDRYGIPRPTVLVTEWGWEYDNLPDPGRAMLDIAWAAQLYAPYPELKGAAIWYLGGGYSDIANRAQALIAPVRDYALGNYFAIPLPPARQPINPGLFGP